MAATTLIPIDRAGRLVLPKAIRRSLHLGPGDRLEAEVEHDGVRLRRATAGPARIVPHGGREVWDAPGAAATAEEVEAALARGPAERDRRGMGL